MNPDQVFGLVFVLACGTIIPLALVFGIPVARALARRVESGTAPREDASTAELEDLHRRVADLEERLDFSERLLVRVQEQERLNG